MNELTHYGVKGMKWGVRKDRKMAYRDDKRIRRTLVRDAYDSGRWTKRYNKTYAQLNKKLDRKMDRDSDSYKTKKLKNTVDHFKSERDYISAVNRDRVRRAKEHVDGMISKYENKSIKSLSVKRKNGEEYVKSFANSLANINAVYGLRRSLIRDDSGNPYDRYDRVKTRYYSTG